LTTDRPYELAPQSIPELIRETKMRDDFYKTIVSME
jgi:hypothetical protein